MFPVQVLRVIVEPIQSIFSLDLKYIVDLNSRGWSTKVSAFTCQPTGNTLHSHTYPYE